MRLLSAEQKLHLLLLIISLAFSFGGIGLAVFGFLSPTNGTRGGAFAVAISFFSLFANRPYGKKLFKLLTEQRDRIRTLRAELRGQDIAAQQPSKAEALLEETQAMRLQLDIDVAGQLTQNVFIAWSAGIGTLAWGFGDIVVLWIRSVFQI